MSKLMEALNAELQRLHHNATPKLSSYARDDFESDLYEEQFRHAVDLAFDDLKEEFKDLIRKYGEVYQYGRGGRTVAPSKLIPNGHYAHASKAEYLDLAPLEARWLLKELKRFNDAVIHWNTVAPDSVMEAVREEYADEIKANKGKRRVQRTVVSYE